jgi:hypothetical protein
LLLISGHRFVSTISTGAVKVKVLCINSWYGFGMINQENEWVHGKVKNTNLIRGIRKDVARVMTVMHMKKMAPVVEKVEEEVKKEKKVKKEAAAV